MEALELRPAGAPRRLRKRGVPCDLTEIAGHLFAGLILRARSARPGMDRGVSGVRFGRARSVPRRSAKLETSESMRPFVHNSNVGRMRKCWDLH